MTQEEYLKGFIKPRIMVSYGEYDLKKDKRLLIPFLSGDKVGFINSKGQIKVRPKYAMCYGDCYSNNDYIIVSNPFILLKSEGVSEHHIYNSYGLINYIGEEILPVEYRRLIPAIGNKWLFSAQNKRLEHGVFVLQRDTFPPFKLRNRIIVPFGKYEWISGFSNGLARVKINMVPNDTTSFNAKWGLIDEEGELVAACDYIYPFYNQKFNNRIKAKNKGFDVFIKTNTFGECLFGYSKVVHVNELNGKFKFQQYFCNLKGDEVIVVPEGWKIISGFKDGYAKVENGVNEGIIDKNGYITRTGTKKPRISDDTDYYDLINDGLDGEADAIWNID